MKDLILGIDFGSENIYVSYLRNNVPQLVENDTGDYRTPAYILEKSSDSIIIGKNARNKNGVNWLRNPSQTITFIFNGKSYLIKDFCLKIFKHLKHFYQQKFGDVLLRSVIALPIYFKQELCSLIKDCAYEAGLNPMVIINEPTAIALNYWQSNPNSDLTNLVIYDLGAHNLTISKIDILHQMLILTKNCYFNPNLGIANWMTAQTNYFLERANKELANEYPDEKINHEFLKTKIIKYLQDALISLSQKKELILAINEPIGLNNDGEFIILKPMSEKGINDSYNIFINPLIKTVFDKNEDILIVAGAGANIKAIKEKIVNLGFKKVIQIDNCAHASALGACWYAAIISGIIPGKLVLSLTNNLTNIDDK